MFNQRGPARVSKPLASAPAVRGPRAEPIAFVPPTPYRPRDEAAPASPSEPDASPEAPSPGAATKAPDTPASVDRRAHQRVAVDLTGRFMTQEREEHVCRAIDMSPGGATLRTSSAPPVGTRVVAYLDHVGRIEGEVTRAIEGGFAMTVKATLRRRDKLAAQLTYLANRAALSLPEDRRHARVSLSETSAVLTLVNGTQIPIDIIDASVSGAAVATDVRPDVGTPGFVGAVRGRIVRHIEGGLAIEFAQVQDADLLEAALIDGRPNA